MNKPFTILTAFAISCSFCVTVLAGKPPVALFTIVRQQKIKHPTEAMSKEQHTAILNAIAANAMMQKK